VVKYFALDGGNIIAEYEASGANALVWKTSYVYLGGQLLATTSGIDGTETRFHHPDRLGTRLVTDAGGTVVSEQFSLPFRNMLPFTSVPGGENPYQHPTLGNPSKKRFTSYDRSDATRLDYAVNRFYSPQQGRFTQVDPIGMGAAELANPQSLNLYAYVENDPINSRDPLGLDGTIVFRPFPVPTGGGSGGGGLKIGPFSIGFSFWDGWYFSRPLNRYQWFKDTEQPGEDGGWVKVSTGHTYDSDYGEVILLTNGYWDYMRNRLPKMGINVFRDTQLTNTMMRMLIVSWGFGFGLGVGAATTLSTITTADIFPLSVEIGAAMGGIGDEESGGTLLTTTSYVSSKRAETLINSGANEVTVESWADADAIRRNLIEGQGYRNSTGYTGRQVRNNPDVFPEGKARTFHWDYADTQHGGRPHLQIHTPQGRIIRIFFNKGAGIPIRTPTGKR